MCACAGFYGVFCFMHAELPTSSWCTYFLRLRCASRPCMARSDSSLRLLMEIWPGCLLSSNQIAAATLWPITQLRRGNELSAHSGEINGRKSRSHFYHIFTCVQRKYIGHKLVCLFYSANGALLFRTNSSQADITCANKCPVRCSSRL